MPLTRADGGSRPAPRFPSLTAQTLPLQVARAIIGSILLGHFKPGEPLPSAGDLAGEFQVSRPVVREALKIVATVGMVTSRQGRYSRVAEHAEWNDLAPELLSARLEVGAIDDLIADSLELRRVIETEAAALAAQRASEEDLAFMRREFDVLSELRSDTQEYTPHDVAFHDAILHATHNRLFLQLIDQMHEVLVLTRTVSVTSSPGHLSVSQLGHDAIFEAIVARNPDRARQAMAEHLRWAERVNVSAYRTAHTALGAARSPAATMRRRGSPRSGGSEFHRAGPLP